MLLTILALEKKKEKRKQKEKKANNEGKRQEQAGVSAYTSRHCKLGTIFLLHHLLNHTHTHTHIFINSSPLQLHSLDNHL